MDYLIRYKPRATMRACKQGESKMWRRLLIASMCVVSGCSKGEGVNCGPGTVLREGTCIVAALANEPSGSTASPNTVTQTPEQRFAAELSNRLMARVILSEAVDIVRPIMSDAQDDWSAGGLALTAWAAKYLRWEDVAVAKNETSFALARKDSEEARGKRMCTAGGIVQIEKRLIGGAKVYSGLLMTDGVSIFSFYAVGSTGEIVARSRARLCGIVVGTYDYANSAGGQGHAVAIVGMFDLPENRKL